MGFIVLATISRGISRYLAQAIIILHTPVEVRDAMGRFARGEKFGVK